MKQFVNGVDKDVSSTYTVNSQLSYVIKLKKFSLGLRLEVTTDEQFEGTMRKVEKEAHGGLKNVTKCSEIVKTQIIKWWLKICWINFGSYAAT
jgi:hypothetical protein